MSDKFIQNGLGWDMQTTFHLQELDVLGRQFREVRQSQEGVNGENDARLV